MKTFRRKYRSEWRKIQVRKGRGMRGSWIKIQAQKNKISVAFHKYMPSGKKRKESRTVFKDMVQRERSTVGLFLPDPNV